MNNDNEGKAYILSKIKKNQNGCWIWQSFVRKSHNRAVFGQYWQKKYNFISNIVSRSAFALWRPTEFDPELFVLHGSECHKDDASRCVNPFHCHVGTQKENIDEAVKYGSWLLGEDHSRAVFTNKQVKQIKKWIKQGIRAVVIARKLGINDPPGTREYTRIVNTLSQIKRGSIWKSV
jgi:hypothetical protein